MQTIKHVRQHVCNGETVTATEVINCNALLSIDLASQGVVANQHFAFGATAAHLQAVFISANSTVIVSINGVDAVWTYTATGPPTAGTFTTSGTIPSAWTASGIGWNTTASAMASIVQAAIVAVSGGANTVVTGTGGPLPGTPIALTLSGTLAVQPITGITTSSSGLTGGTVAASSTTTGLVPDETFDLSPSESIVWTVLDVERPNPITSNITQLNLTSLVAAMPLVQVRLGSN